MQGSGRDGREELVAKLFEMFAQRGYEGVSIGDISQATGLGRSSLYHHFPGGKEEMVEAVIALTRDTLEQNVFAPLKRGGAVAARIDAMFVAVNAIYASGTAPCVLAALLTSPPDSALARRTVQAFADWTNAIADTVCELGAAPGEARRRARVALSLLQGGLVMARALNDPGVFREAMTVARDVLLAEADKP
jgi:AcrR family transcriptional regulator